MPILKTMKLLPSAGGRMKNPEFTERWEELLHLSSLGLQACRMGTA